VYTGDSEKVFVDSTPFDLSKYAKSTKATDRLILTKDDQAYIEIIVKA
jgi:hypothetical protein